MYLKTPEDLFNLLIFKTIGYNRGQTEFNHPSYIVSSNDLTSQQISLAEKENRMYVDDNGFGYVVIFGK